ncbi:Structural maintenance of chromosomes protein 1A [Nosema granulosis]|uniref:Structural maintenance of chromosomes protein 1A n=1 Tax=Nosema granulosis TaxID=83296 RepID=A0A9P6GXV6_9MICR|nr:Structural maintenance of chromosomes protein 1A [Nosema granulosis]
MPLEKIEVDNFKSYAGIHTIGPFDKFTCVVGPNGSGKSNIMDAIAFALGFASTNMRTSTCANLIHNGCSYASVKLFIDTHTFRRHVVSSGRSTYFLDSKLVSFEEYTKELSKLGLDLKLRNFMVFQGDIHEMANKTPKELCEYFEQLSGSIEYKKKYDELAQALNKDLAQCGLLYEHKKRVLMEMKEERDEKKQVELFQNSLKEKASLEKQILNLEIRKLREQLRETEVNLSKETGLQKETGLVDEVLKKKEEVTTARREYSALEQGLQDLKMRKMEQIRQLAAIYKSKDRRNIKKKEIYEQIEENQKTLKELKECLKKGEEELERLEESYSSVKVDLSKEKEDLYLEKTKALRGELARLNLKKIQREKEINRQNKKKKEQEKEQQRARLLEKNVEALKKNINELKSKMGEDLKRYEDLEKREEEANKKVYETVSALLKIRAYKKINIKRETTRSVVSTLRGIFPGVHGLLVDLIRPVQKKYYGPIHTILQAYEYAVVVDSDTTALACMGYIKEKKLCKLTFLPLRTLKGSKSSRCLEADYRSALLCVSFEEQFTKAVEVALGDSIIADTKEVAMELVYQKGIKNNVCTLESFYIRSQGRIISKSQEENEEENNFSRLVEERKNLLKEIKRIQEEKSKMSKIEIIKERIKVYEEKIKKDEEEIGRIENSKVSRIDNENLDVSRIDNENLEVSRIDNENLDVSRIDNEKIFIENEMKKIGESIFGSRDFSYEREKEFCRIKEKLVLKNKQTREEIEEVENLIEDLKKEKFTEKPVENLDPKIENEIRRMDFLVEQKKIDLEDQQRELEEINLKYKEYCRERKEIHKKYLNLESLKTRLEEEIEEKKRFAMLEEIEVEDNAEDKANLNELKVRLELVNKRINDLVPTTKAGKKTVDYSKILKDYEDAKNKALESRKAMNDIKRLRLQAFMGCFEKVSGEIGKIYQEISHSEKTRGNAYLVLDNPVEPYLDGVRFHIMPPSKRFREIAYLSGGEKSMGILALMFAINHFRPVPFFVLDEFDSALDKTNVGRMVDFFVRSQSQFLVISLKPILFQHSDSLIGVYKDTNSHILTYRM